MTRKQSEPSKMDLQKILTIEKNNNGLDVQMIFKSILSLGLCLVLLIALIACSAQQTNGRQAKANNTGEAGQEVPKQTQVLVGTLNLKGTPNEVTPAQGQELLFLWKAVRFFSKEDATAQEEISALWVQIQEKMSKEQQQAISVMNISNKDVAVVLQQSASRTGGTKAVPTQRAGEGGRGPGGMMGFGGGGGAPVGQNTQSTNSNRSQTPSIGMDTRLVEVIIAYLQTIVTPIVEK